MRRTIPHALGVVLVATTLAACSPPTPAQPVTQPVDQTSTAPSDESNLETFDSPEDEAPPSQPAHQLGQPFTVAWEMSDGPRNFTVTAKTFICGAGTKPLMAKGAKQASSMYGELAEPAPRVPSGFTLCAATLKIANTGKKHAGEDPEVKAIDPSGVEYDQDDRFTQWVGSGQTGDFGADVSLNPRSSAASGVAWLIPSDTTITSLRYVGDPTGQFLDSGTALVTVP
jgi:hypothetical protein